MVNFKINNHLDFLIFFFFIRERIIKMTIKAIAIIQKLERPFLGPGWIYNSLSSSPTTSTGKLIERVPTRRTIPPSPEAIGTKEAYTL